MSSGGTKYDEGKLRHDLIPPEHLEGLARVFTMGAEKYGDNNWKEGISNDRLYAAVRRHEEAYRKGEVVDPESGLHHMYHAAWGNLAIAWNDSQDTSDQALRAHARALTDDSLPNGSDTTVDSSRNAAKRSLNAWLG